MKIILSFFLLIFSLVAFSQSSVDKLMEEQISKDLAKSDKDIADEKASKKAKTWMTRAQLMEIVALQTKLDTNASLKAYEAYQKVTGLDIDKNGKTGKLAKEATEALSGGADPKVSKLYSSLMFQGVTKFQNKNLDGAMVMMELAGKVNPKDTTAALYTSIVAQQVKNNEVAKSSMERYLALGGKDVGIFYSLYSIYKSEKNEKQALEYLEKGIAIHPNNKDLKSELINYYNLSGQQDKATVKLEALLQEDPTNIQTMLNLAIMYDNSGKKDKAKELYNTILQREASNYDTNYNLGVLYFNQGVELNKKLGAMDMNTYKTEGKSLEERIKNEFLQARKFFETCYTQKKDADIKENLKNIYRILKLEDEVKKLEE